MTHIEYIQKLVKHYMILTRVILYLMVELCEDKPILSYVVSDEKDS